MTEEQCQKSLSARASDDLLLIQETMAALGVTAESIQSAIDVGAGRDTLREDFVPLTDEEWRLINPMLPAEPRQKNTMGNREFVNGVLQAMNRGGRWTDYREKGPHSDAVRRRFGRWAHQGTWQRLASHLAPSALSEKRKAELGSVVLRAEHLVRES